MGKAIAVNIEGMSCQHCVGVVTKALDSLEGVEKVAVNLESKQATCEVDEDKVDEKKIREAIDDQGFEVIGFKVLP